MRSPWHEQLIGRLTNAANADGSWGYQHGSAGQAEATALGALALAAHRQEPAKRAAALSWLTELQRADGAVGLSASQAVPCWPSALAMLAWRFAGSGNQDGAYAAAEARAATWLLQTRGQPLAPNPELFGHDTSLRGWSWVDGSHSFVEPTATAMIALQHAGHGRHPHVREGARLLLDRALPEGGWNYGNTRVIRNMLRPFPATTGLALTALANEAADERIQSGVAYLQRTLPTIRTPLSVGWGMIGLAAQDAVPSDDHDWLVTCAARTLRRVQHVPYDAVLLLAGADRLAWARPGIDES